MRLIANGEPTVRNGIRSKPCANFVVFFFIVWRYMRPKSLNEGLLPHAIEIGSARLEPPPTRFSLSKKTNFLSIQ